MGRYIRKLTRIGSIGPTEERGFAIWSGYDIVGVDEDLSAHGLTRVDGWSDERLAEHGITQFTRVERSDAAMYEKLGLRRNDDAR